MPRYITPVPPKPESLLRAEAEASTALREFFSTDFGIQAKLARDTGIAPATLCKISKNQQAPSIEQAMLIEIASQGTLRVEQLCPARADVLSRFLLQRAASLGLSN
jgi:DNA-binding transcriptional regulator YdaS (Cro superfamily)